MMIQYPQKIQQKLSLCCCALFAVVQYFLVEANNEARDIHCFAGKTVKGVLLKMENWIKEH